MIVPLLTSFGNVDPDLPSPRAPWGWGAIDRSELENPKAAALSR